MGTVGPDSPLTERSQLLEALMLTPEAADQLMTTTVVERAMKLGWTGDDVRLHLMTPAMHDVGLRWARAEIGVACEHLASSVCEWLLFTLAGRVRRPPATGPRAVEQVGPARHAIKTSRPDCRTIVGGQAYRRSSSAAAAADVGADLLALEAGTLVRRLQKSA